MNAIVGANHRAARIPITLPVDINGEYVLDEDGKPVKGRTPVVLQVPRFDCMTREQFKAVNTALAAVDDMKGDDGKPLSQHDRSYEMVLAILRQFVSDDEYRLVGGLVLFELEQISTLIQEKSSITVGELLASTNS